MIAGPAEASAGGYVSLGDSYAAGPVIPIQISPYGCLKSDHNYAHLAAPRLGLVLRDPSCSGAKTDEMTGSEWVSAGLPNPPQFGALRADTRLVTLGIGANDIGFTSLIGTCFSYQRRGSPCRDAYTAGGVDAVSSRIAATGAKLASVLQGIHSRSPGAKVLVVNYPAIVPDSGPGCFPFLPVADGDVPWLRAKMKELNQMLAGEAAANGAKVVDWYTASIGHDACKPPVVKWVESRAPSNAAAPVHPNLFGMMAVANLVVAAAR
jgi:hypothetical protein